MNYAAPAVLVASLALATPALSQTRPDFSGTWTLDMTRSASAVQNDPIAPTTLVITQSATEVTIETRRGEKTSAVVYRPGSADSITNPTNRSNLLTSMWHWDG